MPEVLQFTAEVVAEVAAVSTGQTQSRQVRQGEFQILMPLAAVVQAALLRQQEL